MEIGIQTTSWESVKECVALAPELERAGADHLWMGEAYTVDVLTVLGAVAARTTTMRLGPGIINVYSRSAALVAMSMVALDHVSNGRASCGLGSSGPAVVEGLHGIPFEFPLSRMKAYTAVCRQLWSGERAEIADRALRVPMKEGARGMRLAATPTATVPVWWAGLKTASVTATAESADGWLPFMFFPERWQSVWGDAVADGLTRRDPALGGLQIAADVALALGDGYVGEAAEEVLESHRHSLALHIGGMGPRGRNAYTTLAVEYGFEAEALTVQDLYLAGRREEAARALPSELVHGTALVGPPAKVRERLASYRAAGVTMLNATFSAPDPVGQVAALRQICDSL